MTRLPGSIVNSSFWADLEGLILRVVHFLDEGRWRHFVESHPLSNVFHTPEMFQVFAQTEGYRPTLWATIDGDGEALALLLPVQVTLKGGLLRYLTNRAVVYGSVLYDPSPAGEEALAILLYAYIQEVGREVLFTELRNLSDLSAVQPLLNDYGFVYEDHLNYLIDLNRPLEQVMQSVGSRTRKHIRRGLARQEVIVEEISERGQIAACYDLLRKSYATARVPLADRSLFEAAFDVLYQRGMVKFWLARVGEAYVATSVEMLYKDTIYGWYSGIERTYASYTPGELLMWHILKWGVENGYRVYDFGGAGKPGEDYGVRDFKAKFGGELACYGRNTYVHAPTRLAISKVGYQVYRNLKKVIYGTDTRRRNATG
jgi:serine/alanine adding enzyme